MPQVTGSFGRLVVDKETSYKTLKDAASRAGWVIPFVTCGLGREQNLLESNTIAATRNPQEPGLGQVNVSGDITVELGPLAHARLIYFALGGYAVSGTDPGPYTHILTIGSSVPSFVAEVRFSDGDAFNRYALFDGCKVSQWSVNIRTDSFVESTFSVIGSDETYGTTEYDSSPDAPGFAGFTNYNANLKLGGTAVASITEISFTLANNLDENTFAIGGGSVRTSLPEGRAAINGTFTAQFNEEMENYINIAQSSTETSIEIELSRGSGDGSAGNEYMKIYLPEVKLQPPRKEIPGPQGVFLTFNFLAYAADASSAIEVTVKNTIADLSI